ncbi:hypothetical protein GCM10012275_53390 [Longimycelium tulufanense]|uniref:Uncharacterized protein n=1 Tax=Longimycelium tulufanense TaxID=907463 RepID=A0A8J3FWC7_9PSEU|nr:hypothetical protein [Longimycelium tulufanense]GGM76011.1 hypothetical protein GCM10012275_53390 [Longimycelium tulufanense]
MTDHIRTLRMTCATPEDAQAFAQWLHDEEIDVTGVDSHDVLIPWGGHPMFPFDIAEAAVREGLAHDRDVCRSVELALSGACPADKEAGRG